MSLEIKDWDAEKEWDQLMSLIKLVHKDWFKCEDNKNKKEPNVVLECSQEAATRIMNYPLFGNVLSEVLKPEFKLFQKKPSRNGFIDQLQLLGEKTTYPDLGHKMQVFDVYDPYLLIKIPDRAIKIVNNEMLDVWVDYDGKKGKEKKTGNAKIDLQVDLDQDGKLKQMTAKIVMDETIVGFIPNQIYIIKHRLSSRLFNRGFKIKTILNYLSQFFSMADLQHIVLLYFAEEFLEFQ